MGGGREGKLFLYYSSCYIKRHRSLSWLEKELSLALQTVSRPGLAAQDLEILVLGTAAHVAAMGRRAWPSCRRAWREELGVTGRFCSSRRGSDRCRGPQAPGLLLAFLPGEEGWLFYSRKQQSQGEEMQKRRKPDHAAPPFLPAHVPTHHAARRSN